MQMINYGVLQNTLQLEKALVMERRHTGGVYEGVKTLFELIKSKTNKPLLMKWLEKKIKSLHISYV